MKFRLSAAAQADLIDIFVTLRDSPDL